MRRQIYCTEADWEAVHALSKRWGLVRVTHGVEVPNLSATVVRAIGEAMANEGIKLKAR